MGSWLGMPPTFNDPVPPQEIAHADQGISPATPGGGLTNGITQPCASDPSKTCHAETALLGNIYGKVFYIFTLVAGFLAVGFFIYNGIRYISAAGDATKLKTARAAMINTLIGIAIITATYWIIRLSQTIGNTVFFRLSS